MTIAHDYTTQLLKSVFTRWKIPSVAAYRVSYPGARRQISRFHSIQVRAALKLRSTASAVPNGAIWLEFAWKLRS